MRYRTAKPTHPSGRNIRRGIGLAVGLCLLLSMADAPGAKPTRATESLRALLDAPLLFTKRHSYVGIHIYDTYYKWKPGGGIYILENPGEPPSKHRVRAVIDATTPETLGGGIYSDPELSWDATRLLFCHKPEQNGSTSIYEIGVDGTGLRRITDPHACEASAGAHGGQHDVSPAYLPDGRIVFTTTRLNGLVPCANSGVDILHVANADGTGIHPISVNNVNEFDPCVLPDGRLLYGRWEYVDKTALTQQSLWTMFPDGTNETALFANNVVRLDALLDARPVPGAPYLIAAALTRHNAPPRGAVGIVDTHISKNSPDAIANFDAPDQPDCDTGDSCEPWPLSENALLFSGRQEGAERNALMIATRDGRREIVFEDADICAHSPILVKPRPSPRTVAAHDWGTETTGRFYLQDIYRGLEGVERGEVKWLRVIEETSRASATPGGAYNQTFLVSAALAFSAKNYLGLVPVLPDGSAHFEVPSGRAIYLQALDEEGRLVRSMRTFVHAVPGTTRSCIGCHERKFDTPANQGIRQGHRLDPVRPQPESWGTGYIDYASMVQPVFDKHCVRCHGGEQGFADALDLTGGWTEHFNVSYENLVSRRESQLTASLIAGIDCMNGTALWSAQILGTREHGSGCAPLAEVLVSGHGGRIPGLSRTERDLVLAWIDTNGVYYGTWDYSEHGSQVKAWPETKQALVRAMREAGCMSCHENHGKVQFENDWFNLQRPEWSRILRAPLAAGAKGGLGLCRDQKTDPRRRRIRLLVSGNYEHGVRSLDDYRREGKQPAAEASEAAPVATFASTEDPHYQNLLRIIRRGHRDALTAPRVDMPGAVVVAGYARQLMPPPLPEPLPVLDGAVDPEGIVRLSWERSARTIGLIAEIHRGASPDFDPSADTLLATTRGFHHADLDAPVGEQHYALILCADAERTTSVHTTIAVPPAATPPAPVALAALPTPGFVELGWEEHTESPLRYHVYRAVEGSDNFERLTDAPTPRLRYDDAPPPGATYAYTARAVTRRGIESDAGPTVLATALPEFRDPVFTPQFARVPDALVHGDANAPGTLHGDATTGNGLLDLRKGGHLTFDHRPQFDLAGRFSIECWIWLTRKGDMPIVVSCGQHPAPGWFLQRIGAGWRWYAGGLACDGGDGNTLGQWVHLAATFDGQNARLYQDGRLVAQAAGLADTTPWPGPLHVGQYGAGVGPQYQTKGWISGLTIFECALSAEDIRAHAEQGAPQDPTAPRARTKRARRD